MSSSGFEVDGMCDHDCRVVFIHWQVRGEGRVGGERRVVEGRGGAGGWGRRGEGRGERNV